MSQGTVWHFWPRVVDITRRPCARSPGCNAACYPLQGLQRGAQAMNSATGASGVVVAVCRVYQRGFQSLCAYFQAQDRDKSGTLARSQFKRALLDLNIGRALDSMTADILLNQGAGGSVSRQSL